MKMVLRALWHRVGRTELLCRPQQERQQAPHSKSTANRCREAGAEGRGAERRETKPGGGEGLHSPEQT